MSNAIKYQYPTPDQEEPPKPQPLTIMPHEFYVTKQDKKNVIYEASEETWMMTPDVEAEINIIQLLTKEPIKMPSSSSDSEEEIDLGYEEDTSDYPRNYDPDRHYISIVEQANYNCFLKRNYEPLTEDQKTINELSRDLKTHEESSVRFEEQLYKDEQEIERLMKIIEEYKSKK